MRYNPILDVDSYKASHWLQYPPNTTAMYSYLESRGGQYPATVFFGLQYILKEYLTRRVESWMVDEAVSFFAAHGLPFNESGWRYIVRELQGFLPVRIKAVPEGTVVPTGNVLMTIESTDPNTFWLVSWLETMLLRVWYPTTVATRSWYLKQIIYRFLNLTADDPDEEIGFKLHDFGARGVSSCESSGIGGMAHLINFSGSDTVQGVLYANHYYNHPMAAYSIPAAEHSTIIAWGRKGEESAYRNILTHFAKPESLVAVVSDSYDIWNAVDSLWGERLRESVRESGATVIIRPDSGDPVEVVQKILGRLEHHFGSRVNRRGYKVLNHVRVIQGDGVDEDSITQILENITASGYSASNIAFGMGGALLQKVNRDTQKFAIKCSEVTVDGQAIAVYKNPITDPDKASKKGRLSLIKTATGYHTAPESGPDEMVTVFENGVIVREFSLEEIRQRTK